MSVEAEHDSFIFGWIPVISCSKNMQISSATQGNLTNWNVWKPGNGWRVCNTLSCCHSWYLGEGTKKPNSVNPLRRRKWARPTHLFWNTQDKKLDSFCVRRIGFRYFWCVWQNVRDVTSFWRMSCKFFAVCVSCVMCVCLCLSVCLCVRVFVSVCECVCVWLCVCDRVLQHMEWQLGHFEYRYWL